MVSAPEARAVSVGLGLFLGLLVGCFGAPNPERAQKCNSAAWQGFTWWPAGSHPRVGPHVPVGWEQGCRRLLPSRWAAPRPGCSEAVLVVPAQPAVEMVTVDAGPLSGLLSRLSLSGRVQATGGGGGGDGGGGDGGDGGGGIAS